ncbi:MAG: hypothetical protein ACTS4T_00735 [Candidatus Hodgkinia cicadicola]
MQHITTASHSEYYLIPFAWQALNHFVKVGSPSAEDVTLSFTKLFTSAGCPFGLSGTDDCVSTLSSSHSPPSTCFSYL